MVYRNRSVQSETPNPPTGFIHKEFTVGGWEDEFIAWLERKDDPNGIWLECNSLDWGTLDLNQIWFFFGFGGASNPRLRIDLISTNAQDVIEEIAAEATQHESSSGGLGSLFTTTLAVIGLVGFLLLVVKQFAQRKE